MTVTLVTVPDVPIVSTGTYQLASGETTFSQEHLAAAVAAASDPTVPAPRLKLGHTDPRFAEAVASGELDGEPAFGTVQNLRLSDDGQTVIGDYVDVPEWLADSLASSYPGRSIEGGFNYTAASGHSYELVISACALLGVTWPGVTSLDDLREVLDQNGVAPEAIAASGGEVAGGRVESFVVARLRRTAEHEPAPGAVLAGMDLGTVRQQFLGDLDTGEVPRPDESQPQADDVGPQIWWWPRSVRIEDDGTLTIIVDDDEGHLIRVPFTVEQGDLLYGQPELVIEQYVPVTSDPDGGSSGSPVSARGPRVLASWPVRAATRPSTTPEVTTMDVDTAVLRKRLGLAEDADDAAITEALAAEPTPAPATEPAPAAPAIPEGMALVDQATLDTIRDGAQQGVAVAARLAKEDRDKVILAAIQAGKFPVSRKAHYETMWDRDQDGTRTLLTASVQDGGLAAGLVPAGAREVGNTTDPDNQSQAVEAQHDGFMAQHFPNEHARLRASVTSRTRVRQEA